MNVSRLKAGDRSEARELFKTMAAVFEEEHEALSDAYVDRLLANEGFWALAAFEENKIVGGMTAHILPMTKAEISELFIYDVAVAKEHQRKGVGKALLTELRRLAALSGIKVCFVPADSEDIHALDFYRKAGGIPSAVTYFTFNEEPPVK